MVNQVQTCPGWGKYFQSMSSISEQTNQALGFPFILRWRRCNERSSFQYEKIFLLNVTDPSAYVKAYTELMEVANCKWSYFVQVHVFVCTSLPLI